MIKYHSNLHCIKNLFIVFIIVYYVCWLLKNKIFLTILLSSFKLVRNSLGRFFSYIALLQVQYNIDIMRLEKSRVKRMWIQNKYRIFFVGKKAKPSIPSVRIKVEETKRKTKIQLVPIKKPSDYQLDVKKHQENTKTILRYSNATAIQGHTDNGYSCCFCDNTYIQPAELKRHNLETHTPSIDDINIEPLVPKVISMLCVKLDITDLVCTICHKKIDTVETLIKHLQDAHDKHFHNDITHQILPFKFETDDLQCYVCRNTFNKFKTLMEHMNVHYRNFICDVCDAGFINQRKLYHHKVAHNTGTFSCSQCPKTFPTYIRQRAHERQYHELGMLVNKCRLCNALFKNNRQKDRHLEKEHGVLSFARKCHACGKTFVHQNALNIHMKRHHLVERTHKCSECDKGFFSSTELRAHMVTHTGVKKYQCGVCLKSYVRKWTLNEHMRIHMDDRRFKCEHCGQAFVQKCSWRGHMRSKHEEQV